MATGKTAKAGSAGKTKVIFLNLPMEIAAALKEEADAEDRPMTVQAARILKQHFDTKQK